MWPGSITGLGREELPCISIGGVSQWFSSKIPSTITLSLPLNHLRCKHLESCVRILCKRQTFLWNSNPLAIALHTMMTSHIKCILASLDNKRKMKFYILQQRISSLSFQSTATTCINICLNSSKCKGDKGQRLATCKLIWTNKCLHITVNLLKRHVHVISPLSWTCSIPGFTTYLYLNQSTTACSDKSFNFTDFTLTTCHQFNKRIEYQTESQEWFFFSSLSAENAHWWPTEPWKASWHDHHSSAAGGSIPSCVHAHKIRPSSAHDLW